MDLMAGYFPAICFEELLCTGISGNIFVMPLLINMNSSVFRAKIRTKRNLDQQRKKTQNQRKVKEIVCFILIDVIIKL